MQGTGTETDPYLIETWDDFFAMANGTATTYYKLMNDLDANDYNDGVFGLKHAIYGNLDGNGKTIRNIHYFEDSPAGYDALFTADPNETTHWKNLNIESISTNCCLFYTSGSGRTLCFTNCVFEGECDRITYNVAGEYEACTLSLDLIKSLHYSSATKVQSRFTRCNIKCRISNPVSTWSYFIASYSRVEIAFGAVPSAPSSSYAMETSNSILVISFPDGTSTENQFLIKGDAENPSALDATLWGAVPTDGITDVIMLPTADMKNTDALNAAGFTVVRVS